MNNQKGIVVKIKGSCCIIVTPEGIYKKIRMPLDQPGVGAEVSFREQTWINYVKPLALVASIIFLVTFIPLIQSLLTPQPVAYVSLDINPSIELAVAEDGNVINAIGLNTDGEKLIQKLDLEKRTVGEAAQLLIREAIQQKYLAPGQEGLVIATVAQADTRTDRTITSEVSTSLASAVARGKINSTTIVYEVNDALRGTAQNQGVTAGKYLILRQAQISGGNVKPAKIKSMSARRLMETFDLDLLPNDQIIVLAEAEESTNGTIGLKQLLNKYWEQYQSREDKTTVENGTEEKPEKTEQQKKAKAKQEPKPTQDRKTTQKPMAKPSEQQQEGSNNNAGTGSENSSTDDGSGTDGSSGPDGSGSDSSGSGDSGSDNSGNGSTDSGSTDSGDTTTSGGNQNQNGGDTPTGNDPGSSGSSDGTSGSGDGTGGSTGG